MSNVENVRYLVTINENTPFRPRKRKRKPKTWKRNVEKRFLYNRLYPSPVTCNHNCKGLRCATLTAVDIHNFNTALYAKSERSFQHNFLLKYMQFIPIERRRSSGQYSPQNFRTKYYIYRTPVCLKTFLKITRYSKGAIMGIAKAFHGKSGNIDDERGGFRQRQQFDLIIESIKDFVASLNFVESHYCRGRTEKKYLPSELNLTKLYSIYMKSIEDNPPFPPDCGLSIKLSYFRYVVQTECNISFTMPQTDQCSTCLQYKDRIKNWPKNERNSEAYVLVQAEFAIHKKRAKAYYEILKEYDPDVYICSYDCQKNMPLPKLPDGATYYSRQIYYQNFTIVSGNSHVNLNPSNTVSYCWRENQFNRNSNLISSCVFDHLRTITNWPMFKSVKLVSDGCASQNKNSAMLAMAAYWLLNEAPNHISEIEFIFPVTGHSFIPPDRVFAQIEKKAKKIETIETVEEFTQIISGFSTVRDISQVVNIFNFKEAAAISCKTPAQLHFQISKCKRIFVRKDPEDPKNILIRGELYYKLDTGKYASIFKARKNGLSLVLSEILERNFVSDEKKKDVNALLIKHYGPDWRRNQKLNFYSYVLDGVNEVIEPSTTTATEEEEDNPEPMCELNQEVIDQLVV